MGSLITDDILSTFAVVEEKPEASVETFKARYGDLVDRTTANFAATDQEHREALMAKLRA